MILAALGSENPYTVTADSVFQCGFLTPTRSQAMDSPRIVAVVGSLRDGSYTRLALEHALDAAREAGGDVALLDLREYDLPVYDPDTENTADAEELMREIREADVVLLERRSTTARSPRRSKTRSTTAGSTSSRKQPQGCLR